MTHDPMPALQYVRERLRATEVAPELPLHAISTRLATRVLEGNLPEYPHTLTIETLADALYTTIEAHVHPTPTDHYLARTKLADAIYYVLSDHKETP